MATCDVLRTRAPILDTGLSSDYLVAQSEVFTIVDAAITSTRMGTIRAGTSSVPTFLDPPYWHDTYEIGCILRGTGVIVMGQRMHPYVPGQVYIINDFEPHRYYSHDEESQLLVVHFHPSLLESGWMGQARREIRKPFLSQFGPYGPLIPLDDPLTTPIRNLLETLREEALRRRPFWDVIASGLLLQAVGLLTRQMTQAIEYSPEELQRRRALKRIQPILQLLQTRYTEALSLDELASVGCMSSSYCCELFQVAFNTTPIAYRNQLRLDEARRLMQTTDLTIHDIAYRVGFQSVQEFNRLFRRDTGCSPSQFRTQVL